jgi:hypothetical protein
MTSSPSIVVISAEFVPAYVPSGVIVSLPTSDLVSIESTLWVSVPTNYVISVPASWSSPVAVPATLVFNVPTS